MRKKILEINDISFQYPQGKTLFKDLKMHVYEGETIGLIGSNGAGKSTLLKLLVGLQMPVTGSIQVDLLELSKKSLHEIRKKIGFSFQDTDNQLFMTTVFEDVAFGPRNAGMNEKEVTVLVKKVLEQVDATHLADRPPYKLSGGEKRAVALATVLSMKPEIIVLDEPTTGLDPRARRNLIRLLRHLPQTKMIATHDMDMALELCDRVIVIHDGKVVLEGEPTEVFKDASVLNTYHLEQPLTMQGCRICSKRE